MAATHPHQNGRNPTKPKWPQPTPAKMAAIHGKSPEQSYIRNVYSLTGDPSVNSDHPCRRRQDRLDRISRPNRMWRSRPASPPWRPPAALSQPNPARHYHTGGHVYSSPELLKSPQMDGRVGLLIATDGNFALCSAAPCTGIGCRRT